MTLKVTHWVECESGGKRGDAPSRGHPLLKAGGINLHHVDISEGEKRDARLVGSAEAVAASWAKRAGLLHGRRDAVGQRRVEAPSAVTAVKPLRACVLGAEARVGQ